ncbi:hypothetical protein, partial [Proteus myxofaciens]|uniref:hypothetical protein n=1 Tax=Proteus myxofaciens TaxID=184072 RepID=UPI001B313273
MNIEFLIKNAISNLNSINSIKIHTSNTLNKIIFKSYNTIIPFIKPIINKIVNHKNLSTSIINIKNQSADNRNTMESDTIKIENKKINEITNKVTNEVTKDVSKEVPKEVSKEVPKEISKEVANEVSKDVSKEVANEVSEDVSNEVVNEVTNKIIIDKDKVYAIKSSINNEVKKYIIDDLNHNLKLFKDLDVNNIEKIKINIMENIENFNIIPSLQEVCVLLNIDGIKSINETKHLEEIKSINEIKTLDEIKFIDKTNPIEEVLDSNIEKLYKAIVDPIFEVTKDTNKYFIAENIKIDIKKYLNIEI